ncbi:MAG: AmmeMemoRadiSam system radical SAM enzyme [archaeon]
MGSTGLLHPAAYATVIDKADIDADDKTVRCSLCPRRCMIRDGKEGFCRVRVNENGTLYSTVYGKAAAANVDPIEKKPLYHFLPGTKVFSFGTLGCTLRCKHCQNWEISQAGGTDRMSMDIPPKRIVQLAKRSGCPTVAATYNEPFVFFEYMRDTAKLVKEAGLRMVLVSNGYVEPAPLKDVLPLVDAINIDLKGFSQRFYGSVTASTFKPVLKTIETLAKSSVHLELTNLIILSLNDDPKGIKEMCEWIVSHCGHDVPMHFSAFFPHFELDHIQPTPSGVLLKAKQIAKAAGMHHVYLGNVRLPDSDRTFCPGCDEMLIDRDGYDVIENRIKDSKCPECGRKISGVFS